MREISTQALRAFKDENTGAIEVVKSSMQGAVEALRRELPPDFPKGQIGDLRRHIVQPDKGIFSVYKKGHSLRNRPQQRKASIQRTRLLVKVKRRSFLRS